MAACRDDEAHLGTGFWLMYLVFAVVLNFVLKYTLPV